MLTVSQLATRFNISPDTVRHYVRSELLVPTKDAVNGYKRFDREDQKRLGFILQAKSLGFSLGDIKSILGQAEKGRSPCPQVREMMEQRMKETEEKIAAMQATLDQMKLAMQTWQAQPDCLPTGDHICHLIEGFSEGGCCDE